MSLQPPVVMTDARSRVVLAGHPDERFIVVENSDGSILLEPAVTFTVTRAQLEYDSTPALQRLLSEAAESPTVRRTRSRRTS